MIKRKLQRYLFLKENNEISAPCEIGIVFGGYEMIPNRADVAIDLYKKGMIKNIILTGKYGYLSFHRKETEADLLYKYLIKNGVKKESIILEDKSKNTFQNILNSYNIIKNRYHDSIKVVLITSDFHLKRCLFIAENFFNLKSYGYSVKSTKYKKVLLINEIILLNYYKYKFRIFNSF